jgi:hypothetical protein
MLDINQYTYTQNAFSHNKKYSVYPLDDAGVKTYYHDKDAHTHTFLDKINPREMRKIYAEKKVFDEQIDKLQAEKDAAYKKKYHSVEKNGNNLKSLEKLENCQTNLENEEKNQQDLNDKEQCNYNDNNEQQNEVKEHNHEECTENRVNKHVVDNYYDNRNDANLRSHTSENFYGKSKNNLQCTLTGNLNGYTRYGPLGQQKKKFRLQHKLDEKLACFGNSNFGKRVHPMNIPQISKYKKPLNARYDIQESNADHPCSHEDFYLRPFQKIGFESYNVPRVNKSTNIKPIQFNQFNNKCFKSLSGFFNSQDENFDKYLNKENSRLTDILLDQTSQNYLKNNKLPKISYIVNQPEITIKKTGIGNSKFMGGKYNPFNFNSADYKNKTKRNTSGALFLH